MTYGVHEKTVKPSLIVSLCITCLRIVHLFRTYCNTDGGLLSLQANFSSLNYWNGLSGGAMVLSKLPVPGRPTIWFTVGQGPTALAMGAGGGCLDVFTLIYPFFSLSPSLWETAR